MTVLPASFGRCRSCGRLITVGGVNQNGSCTKDCGGSVKDPAPRQLEPWEQRWAPAIDALAVAHHCPNPDDCSFGGEGCRP